ncbi:hypothetical protein AB0F81_11655 [Actinoplanes sp. NPDC024001]|uniref:hypothetical protein n=1 Tax=Actinoplanes sp. NPDC024001 TaxID=3154598 RepID=UPI003408AC1C
MIVVTTWKGRNAEALRLALRLSCDDFANRLGVSPRGVAKWAAKPDAALSLQSHQLLDHVLREVDDEVRARYVQMVTDLETTEAADAEPTTTSVVVPADRGLDLPAPTPEILASLQAGLHHHYTSDNLLGPRALLPTITAHANAIERLARQASGTVLDELLKVGAGYAEFAGWLFQDSGDASKAREWYLQALEWSEAGGDERMAAFVLTRRAVQAISTRSGAQAAKLARAAQRNFAPETARVRTLAAQTEALGYAVHGLAGDCDQALDQAERILAESGGVPLDGDPSDGRYCDMRLYLDITRAKCHLELRRATEAVSSFQTVLETLPRSYHRDRGQYLARLAQAYVLAESPDEACSQASEALPIAVATGSSRTIGELQTLHRDLLRRWPTHPAVAHFSAQLASLA